MAHRSEQLQIRITPRQKAALRRAARGAGLDVSAYVLSRALPERRSRLAELVEVLRSESEPRFALAELNELLAALAPAEFSETVDALDLRGLAPMLQNYVTALVEQGASVKHVRPPGWTREILPLDAPYFATSLRSVRPYLLRVTPVPFRRRNIFTDAGVGARV